MLLRDWSVRTENPWDANAFFIPDRSIEHTSNLGSPAGHLSNVIDYIKERYPFWNRTRGRDHFSFQTGELFGFRLAFLFHFRYDFFWPCIEEGKGRTCNLFLDFSSLSSPFVFIGSFPFFFFFIGIPSLSGPSQQ